MHLERRLRKTIHVLGLPLTGEPPRKTGKLHPHEGGWKGLDDGGRLADLNGAEHLLSSSRRRQPVRRRREFLRFEFLGEPGYNDHRQRSTGRRAPAASTSRSLMKIN